MITVTSDLDEDVANARNIVKDLSENFLPDMVKRFPGVDYDLEGQAKRSKESMDSLVKGFIVAAMIIFLLLASQFRSYSQPLIIMAAIPFGLIGQSWASYNGLDITMISIFGIVALSGVVVNDSLILIDFTNVEVAKGTPVFDAVIKSGENRFRPVILTSFTTVAGLAPL